MHTQRRKAAKKSEPKMLTFEKVFILGWKICGIVVSRRRATFDSRRQYTLTNSEQKITCCQEWDFCRLAFSLLKKFITSRVLLRAKLRMVLSQAQKHKQLRRQLGRRVRHTS